MCRRQRTCRTSKIEMTSQDTNQNVDEKFPEASSRKRERKNTPSKHEQQQKTQDS